MMQVSRNPAFWMVKARPSPGCLWHLSKYETILGAQPCHFVTPRFCHLFYTCCHGYVLFFFHVGFYDASIKQAGFIEFFYIIFINWHI